ncbi:hypothetical protein Tco_0617798 [Tanacetum coccineum]
MAVLESCPKHNMAAYLEKTDGNAEFYEIIDFFARSSIYNALTVSPIVSTTFVEQFWMSAKSKIINNVRHLDAKKKFVMYPRFTSIFLDKQLMNVHVPLDHFPVNALTSKVFSFMVKKGKHFSGKITPLFSNMLVQPTEDEGEQSERPSKPLPTPFPPHPSEVQVEPQSDPSPRPSPTTNILDSILKDSGGNQGGQSSSDRSLSGNEGGMTLQSVYDLCISLCTQVTNQAKEIKHLKARIKKLKKKAKPGRKSAKAEPSVHKDPLFDELDDDEIDNMESEDAQGMGRTRHVVYEEKERKEKEVSTEDALGTDKQKDSTDKEKVSTDRPNEDFKKKREREREQFIVEERAKFLHDIIAAQRRFLAEQRAIAIRNRPPTRTQLRNQMMTYLKHVGNQKHSDLKNKTFEEIKALYEKVKRFDESFIAVGSTEDERKIKQVNEGAKDLKQKRLKKKVAKETPKNEDTAKVPAKVDVTEQDTQKRKGGHMKMLARKRKRPQPDVDSYQHQMEISYYLQSKWETFRAFNLISWNYLISVGDLKIMMESSTKENDQSDFWSDQQGWKIVTWRLYEACGVYILELEDGTVIHMVFNSPCFMVKSWLVQDQTDSGKDYSNLLIADSLLKTIWFINAPCYGNEALTSPKENGIRKNNKRITKDQAAKDQYWKIPICYDDDEDIPIAITPVLSTEEPVNSLIMEDEHLDAIPATESNEVIKSSVEILVPIPSESEDIPDNMCDVPFCDNSLPLDISKDQCEGFSDSNNDSTSIDDDSFSIDDIDYVEASPPDSELVSLEKIEAINSNPPLFSDFVTKSPSTFPNSFLEETKTFDNSIPESETFCFDLEENSSGSTTTRSDYSLLDYEAFYFDDDHN